MTAVTYGSLCSGYEGIGLGLSELFDLDIRWHFEVDPNAIKILETRFPDVPNLGDLTTVDWTTVEPVEVWSAGYPCQPFSHAGNRKGTDDERHLWPHIARGVGVLRPRILVLENVRGHVSLGLADVLASLSGLGYDATWGVVPASAVGAPHHRKRLFIVATDTRRQRHGRHQDPKSNGRDEGRAEPTRVIGGPHAALGGPTPVANPHGQRLQGVGWIESSGRDSDGCGSANVAWGDYEPAIRRWERTLGRPAPRPTDTFVRPRNTKLPVGMRGSLRGYNPRLGGYPYERLSARFVEWMMGLPAGWVTDVDIPRNAQLKALGNGVVPQQCAAAVSALLDLSVVAA